MTIPTPPTLQPTTYHCPSCDQTHAAWTGYLPDGTRYQTGEDIGSAQRSYEELWRRIYVAVKVRGN